MTDLQAWKDSLELLKPQNLKLLALVTVNSWVQGWKALFQSKIIYYVVVYWIVLWSSILIPLSLNVHNNLKAMPEYIFYFLLFLLIFFMLCGTALTVVVWVKAIRPSVERKTFAYFMNGLVKQLCFVAIMQLFLLGLFLSQFISNICGVVAALWLFFFLDAQPSLRTFSLSVNRALKMFFYNLPLFFACMLLYAMYAYGMSYIPYKVTWVPYSTRLSICLFSLLCFIQYLLIYPLYICLLNNIYIKKLHEQFNLYFSLPEQKEL